MTLVIIPKGAALFVVDANIQLPGEGCLKRHTELNCCLHYNGKMLKYLVKPHEWDIKDFFCVCSLKIFFITNNK